MASEISVNVEPQLMEFTITHEPGTPYDEQFYAYVKLPFRPMKGDIIELTDPNGDYLLTSGARIDTTYTWEDRDSYSQRKIHNVLSSTIFYAKPVSKWDEE